MHPRPGEWPDEVEVQQVDVSEAARLTDAGLALLLDVREDDEWAARARSEIQAVLDGLDTAGVEIQIDARHAWPADALVAASHDSDLLVVGRHDPHVPFGSHLGPVARAVLHEAACAVELVNRVQAAGLLERNRDEHDARIVRLRLTEKGERCIEQLTELHVAEIGQLAPLLKHVIDGGELKLGPLG